MRRDKLLTGMRDGARRTLRLFYPTMAGITASTSQVNDEELQADIEMIVEQLFHCNELTTTLDDYLMPNQPAGPHMCLNKIV